MYNNQIISMSVLLKNECGVTTILPLGVECFVVDATTPISVDGTIYLNITGGSTPYSITWDNGSKSQNLYSVSAGTYTAQVVDYYGDYSATTTCTVSTEQFYVDFFRDCTDQFSVYLTGLTTTLDEGSIYKLSANTGCWSYSGKVLNGNYSLTIDNILQGPFDSCEECDPPIDTPYYPNTLCLYTENPFTTYQFQFYSFYNEKPAYTGTSLNSLNYSIQWLTGNTNRWEVVGTANNKFTNQNDTYNPLGSWVLNGTQQTWIAVSGTCPSAPELSATHNTSDPTCESSCNGSSIVVSAKGGVSPYQYSFDGGGYSVLPSITSLCPGIHTYTVKDSNNDTFTQTFTINKGKKISTYSVSISYKTIDTLLNYGSQVGRTLQYFVNVSPELPQGVEITLPLSLSIKKTISSPGETTVTYTPYLFSGTTSISPTSNTLTNTKIDKPSPYTYNYPYETTAYTYNVSYNPVVLKKGLTVSGYVTTSITKVSDGTPNCSCSSHLIENPSSIIQYYRWTNCTGGTETGYFVQPGQKTSICACSVSKGSTSSSNDGNSLIITSGAGTLNCNPITNGIIEAYSVLGAASINGNCNATTVQIPNGGLYSSLYGT